VIDSSLSNLTGEKMAYFYCNKAEENRREPQSILNALIHQLAQTESQFLIASHLLYLVLRCIENLDHLKGFYG